MKGLSRKAQVYVLGVIILALMLFVLQVSSLLALQSSLGLFLFLMAGAVTAQFFTVVTPKHQHYYLTPAFFFPAVLLLGYGPLAIIVIVAHAVEWVKVRYAWYIQTFNIAAHIVAGYAARALFLWMLPAGTGQLLSTTGFFAVLSAGLLYTFLNHLLVGVVLVLARNVSLRESQVLSTANLLTDLALISAGGSIAYLWTIEPWTVVLGTAPLVLIHRALNIPTLREEAHVDPKTGLYNAKYFDDVLQEELRRARRFDRPLALVMADLDGLRYVNNTYGHLAGDAVLAVIGEIIRVSVREYDVAARFGGEEFALLMPETTTHEGYVVAERIRKAVESKPITIPTHVDPIYITITVGVASFPADGYEPNQLIHAADLALYQGKAGGKNRVRMSVPGEAEEPETEIEFPGEGSSPRAVGRSAKPATVPSNSANANSVSVAQVLRPSIASEETSEKKTRPPERVHYFSTGMLIYICAITAIGAMLVSVYLPSVGRFDVKGLAILAAFAVVAEIFSVDLYGAGTVSVSFAAIFAAALRYGPTGASVLALAIAIAHGLKRRPRAYQVFFNAANHAISSTAAAIVFALFGVPLHLNNLLFLLVPTLAAAATNYFLSTMLLAIAIGLSEKTSPWTMWKEQYRWLAVHYLVMGLLAMFFVLTYVAFDVWGIVAFLSPLLIMRYSQKQYVDQTVQNVSALRKANAELAHANEEVQIINDELLMTLASAIDARDPYVYGHSMRVANYATAISREMNLRPDRVELVRRAALLHDVGKIGLPEAVLKKEGDLTAEEFEVMKQHTYAADEILGACHRLQNLLPIVRAHHERWDGGGYPNGLRGQFIPLESRILALADAVEAMAFNRTYHDAKSFEAIVAEVEAQAGSQFDPAVAAAFLRVVRRQGTEFLRGSAREEGRMPQWRYGKEPVEGASAAAAASE